MGTPAAFQLGFNQGNERQTQKRSRQEQLQDEERNNKLQVYANLHDQGKIGTPELGHAIEDIYHDAEPEKKMMMFSRLLNRKKAKKQHAEFLQGKQQRATEESGILSGATTTKQLQDEAQKRELELVKAREEAKPSAGPPFKEFSSPDGKQKQWFRVGEEPEGWNASQGEAKPPKPPTPSAQYANLLAKKLLADKKQGPPLTNEEQAQLAGAKGALTVAGVERANAFAKAAAENNLVVTTNEDGADVLTQRSQAVEASKSGTPMTAGVVGAPTASDKQTQMFAQSSLDRLKEMRSIVKNHPEIFGPVGGRTMKASVWLGTQSPEAQKFKQDAQFLAEHSTAVFGGRAASTVDALQKIQSDPTANPEALLAGFDSDESTLNDFVTAQGRLPAPRVRGGETKKQAGAAQHKIGEVKKFPNGKTGKWDGTGWVAQ
jgi:hypothetical protein